MVSLPEQLRKQYGSNGILAGASHFADLWCRDGCFASFGALAIEDFEIVGKHLTTFLSAARDGHVPLRIGSISMLRRFLHLNPGYGPVYGEDKQQHPVIDSNVLLIILAEKYEAKTHKKLDREALRAVMRWIDTHEQDHVLPEEPFTSWEDSLNLSGPRLYTNVLLYRAYLAASRLLQEPLYAARAIQTKLVIKRWWQGAYFMDGPKRDVCMTAGNLLAILYGIADPKQARAILERIGTRASLCPPAGFFPITRAEGYRPFFWIGMADYHAQSVEWSWLGALEVAAYRAINEEKAATEREERLRSLLEHTDFAEVYERDKPLQRFFYKAETNFAWTLGVLIASRPSSVSILR